MKIWLINHYAVPTKYYPLVRPAAFAKYLMRAGHEVTIFAASTVHNANMNLITDGSRYKEDTVDGIHYVYVNDIGYDGNGIRRILNMLLFPPRLGRVCRRFEKPDVILSVSATPMACMKGLKLADRYGCKGVAEIADLWPETFVAYDLAGKRNPLLTLMYAYEKRLYTKADAIVFTMEGGRDYVIGKGWSDNRGGPVKLEKIHHINNGVDLEAFDSDRERFAFTDQDLDDPSTFKVVYAGAIRQVNDLSILVDTAQALQTRGRNAVRLILFGDGDERAALENEAKTRRLTNIVFKGKADKRAIPYILSKADLCLLHWKPTPISKFGMSMNKQFDYFASGKPILANSKPAYDLIERYGAGAAQDLTTADAYADAICRFADMEPKKLREYGKNARRAAQEYDFANLTEILMRIMGI
ncbi:MAG: glycosyltransferase family 4 protein [Eubacteriales bacterium]|nr:glycosyltransferase family 4 protein [Eubacteriales bacterium]